MISVSSNSLVALNATATPVGPAASPNSKPMDSADQQKLTKAAGDFESILLASMWKSMKQSFKDPNDNDSDPANGTIDDWGIEVMSDAVGKSRGLGIGNLILQHLGVDGTQQQTALEHPSNATNVFGKSADREL